MCITRANNRTQNHEGIRWHKTAEHNQGENQWADVTETGPKPKHGKAVFSTAKTGTGDHFCNFLDFLN